jgi:hypothetical protein
MMSVHILYDQFKRKSVMFCSTSDRAFGPVFDNEDAADFTDWMIDQDRDPRDMGANTLDIWIAKWKEEQCAPSAA